MHFVTKTIQRALGNKTVDEIADELTSFIRKFEARAEVLKDKVLESESAIQKATDERNAHYKELERAHAYIEKYEKLFSI